MATDKHSEDERQEAEDDLYAEMLDEGILYRSEKLARQLFIITRVFTVLYVAAVVVFIFL